MFDIYSSQVLTDVPGLKKDKISKFRQRKMTIDKIKDPDYVPMHKYVDNSKILQLAYLDKIIEECDEDQDRNKIRGIVAKTHSFIDEQKQKIVNDDLKIELEVKKEEDFEYQLKFDQSFYGKDSVQTIKQDQFKIRNKI